MKVSNKCEQDPSSSRETGPKGHDNNAGNPLHNLCEYLHIYNEEADKKELSLEVQINDSLKRILDQNARGCSNLLDVTIIKLTDSDTAHEMTVALSKDKVRDFISLIEKYESKRRRKLLGDGHARECNDDFAALQMALRDRLARDGPARTRRTAGRQDDDDLRLYRHQNTAGDSNSVCLSDNFRNLRSLVGSECPEEGFGTACVCQHCGTFGVLVPGPGSVLPTLVEDNLLKQRPADRVSKRHERREGSPSGNDRKTYRCTDLRKKRSYSKMELLKEMHHRINKLEKRMTIQEQTAVPKQYLKHMINSILRQYKYRTGKRGSSDNLVAAGEMKNRTTQYSNKNCTAY